MDGRDDGVLEKENYVKMQRERRGGGSGRDARKWSNQPTEELHHQHHRSF